MTQLQPEPVNRDKYGAWTHSELPNFGESVSYQRLNYWGDDRGISIDIRHMENEIDEELPEWKAFFKEMSADFSKWDPIPPTPTSFLISLHDTEDGPCAWWATPRHK
ncbi:hypothetical protein [Vibrio fluvialis]|uniref:hypothetical protein n=1 Tax=Vibrio fluvialis TaxID=676 RepID=UPI0023A93B1A|nr:hypothetical protein [Vibrio fluvialis]MDE5179908.1 hypothetical protein [Vibrio fluvialis]